MDKFKRGQPYQYKISGFDQALSNSKHSGSNMKRPLNEAPQRSKKKRRTESTSKEEVEQQHGVVSIDQLKWNEVTLPDRFDDAEGFFGLEEIEDVEVVKDAGSGNIVYKVCTHPLLLLSLHCPYTTSFRPEARRKT